MGAARKLLKMVLAGSGRVVRAQGGKGATEIGQESVQAVFRAKKGDLRPKLAFLGAAKDGLGPGKYDHDAAKVGLGASEDSVTGPRSSSVRPRMSFVASRSALAGQRSRWRYHGRPWRSAGRPRRDAGRRFFAHDPAAWWRAKGSA